VQGAWPSPSTKTITVYRNGDGYFPGRKIVLTSRLSTLDALLDLLTSVRAGSGQDAPFGAVQRLYTVQGHRVRRLEQVEAGRGYVAAGNEGFKHLPLCGFLQGARSHNPPVCSHLISVVFRSVQSPTYTLKSWESVLAMVTEKVSLRTGAVHRLCTVEGRPLSGPAQLRNQQQYVAVGAERFKALPYDQRLHNRPPSSNNGPADGRYIEVYTNMSMLVLGVSVFTARRKRIELAGAAEVQEDGSGGGCP
uniref:Si:dkey-25g12.4 n=1 Tax=Neogobius melanostomus TaxID=47308 RepID=A0A8C6TRB2_9GOBI